MKAFAGPKKKKLNEIIMVEICMQYNAPGEAKSTGRRLRR